jgi:non-ribosomal peptide synthetase component F
LIGFFLNHLVLRTRLSGDPSFREVVGRVREVCLGAYAHQDLPFDKLVEVLQPERSMSHTPVFQVLCVVHNVPPSTLQLLGLELESVDSVLPASKFDLSLFVGERDGKMEGQWVYRTDLFEASTIRRLAGQYLGVLNQVLQQPDRAIEDVELLSESTSGEEQASDRSGTTGIRDARRKAAIVVSGSEGAD